jgi:excisionase family DNA binding protein
MFLLSPEAKAEAKIFLKEIFQESFQETMPEVLGKADTEDEILNVTGLADFLKCSEDLIRDKAKSGEIPGHKPGKSYLFIKSEILAWLKSHSQNVA